MADDWRRARTDYSPWNSPESTGRVQPPVIELRPVPDLWPRVGLVMTANWDFSCVRLVNAMPPDADTQ